MKYLILLAVVCWASVSAQDEGAYMAKNYPNPLTDPELCGRGSEKSYICDPNNVLKAEEGNPVLIACLIREEKATLKWQRFWGVIHRPNT